MLRRMKMKSGKEITGKKKPKKRITKKKKGNQTSKK